MTENTEAACEEQTDLVIQQIGNHEERLYSLKIGASYSERFLEQTESRK